MFGVSSTRVQQHAETLLWEPISSLLKAHVQQQNITIWFLLEAAKQQQEQMAEQEKKLLWIQEKGKTRGKDIP